MNSGLNFRARRRAEIEAEHARQKIMAENLEALKAVKSKELRAIKRLQANVRGFLCRLHVLPKYYAEHQAFEKNSLRQIFKVYMNRQSRMETDKERVFLETKFEYEKIKSKISSAIDTLTLRSYIETSGLEWTRPSIDATIADLKKMYINRALQQAMMKCERVNLDFRYMLLESQKTTDLSTHFVYFSKAIGYGTFLVMLRDFKLLCNASTHGYLLQLFQKYAVQVQEEREKVRAIFLYKYFNNKYEQVLTHERVSTMLKLLGCNYDTAEEAKELLNGDTALSERDFVKFWQKHIGDKIIELKEAREKNAESTKEQDKANKKKGAVQLNKLGLKRAGFEAIMLDVCGLYFPKGQYCRCLSCQKKPLPPRTTPQLVHAKFSLRKAMRYHIAPSIYLLEMSGLCGRRTITGRNVLDFKKHLRWWLRFEGNLRNLFAYYATRGWELSPEERLTWDDVATNNTTLPYLDFVRFATDFNIYPKYLTNEKFTGFQILEAFLQACQGNRIFPYHRCKFDADIGVSETSKSRGAMSSKVCSLCGVRQVVLSSQEERRLYREFSLFSDEADNLVFVKDIPEVFEHAGEDPLPAQLYLVDKILRSISKVKKKDKNGKEEECINQSQFLFGIDQGRRLRFQALSSEITFSEFLHALSMLATKMFTYEKLKDAWANPMQELFKIMDPTFRSKFGHSIETVKEENLEKDLMIHTVKSRFKEMLRTLFERYKFLESGLNASEQGITSDAFQLFVKDCRLVPNIGFAQALNMFRASVKASSESTGTLRMNFDQFYSAINGLMFENFCNGKNKPAPMSYFDPMGPGTGITRAGMAIRNAIIKLKFLYEDYNPIGRSSSAGLASALIGSAVGKSDKGAQGGNKAGQYLHLVKRGAKGDEPTMARSRLKRAIRLKSSNLMKLSKLGFGTAMRRDSRLNHIQKLIWDVAEHTNIPEKDYFVADENQNTTSDWLGTTMEKKSTEDPLIITPSAPPSRLNRRSQQSRKSRPGRRLQSKKNKEAFSGYVNIWRSEPHKVRMLLGDPLKKTPDLPRMYKSLSRQLEMQVSMNSIARTTKKNYKTMKWVGSSLIDLGNRNIVSDTSDGETLLSNAENVRFGHPDLTHLIKKRKYHCDEHGAYHYFVALKKFNDRNFDSAGDSLKVGLGIALEQLEIIRDNDPINDRIREEIPNIETLEGKAKGICFYCALVCQLYETLACVADELKIDEESEIHRVHQLHFARGTSHAERDTLIILAADSLASYYVDSVRNEEALRIYENYFHKPNIEKVKSSPNSDADGSMNIDPYLQCRVFLKMASLYEVMLQFDASIACVKEFLVLMRLKKDYRQQRKGFEVIGKIYAKQKNYDTAIQSWGDALAFCPKNSLDRCKIHLLIIKAYETMKNFKSVALHYAHIVDLHESAGSSEDIVCNYVKLQAEALHQLLLFEQQEKENLQNLEATSHSIIALYEKYISIRSLTGGLSDEKDICIAYLRIGDIYYSKLEAFEKAVASYNDAILTVRTRHGSVLFTKANLKLGLALMQQSDFHNAEQTLQVALRSASSKESITNQEHLAKYVYCYLGRLNTKFKEYTKALGNFAKYLSISLSSSDVECAMDAYFNLGMCFLQGFDDGFATRIEEFLLNFSIDGTPLKAGNSLEAATLMFNSLRQLSYEHKNVHRESQSFAGLAECSIRRGLSSVAIGFFESAIELQKRIGDRLGEMEHCGSIGKIQYAIKKYNDAKMYFERQIEIANQLGHEQAIEETGIMLARTYRMLFEEATRQCKSTV